MPGLSSAEPYHKRIWQEGEGTQERNAFLKICKSDFFILYLGEYCTEEQKKINNVFTIFCFFFNFLDDICNIVYFLFAS